MSARRVFFQAARRAVSRRLDRDHAHLIEVDEDEKREEAERASDDALQKLLVAAGDAMEDPTCGPVARLRRAELAYVEAVLVREAWAKGLPVQLVEDES
jgi:hypothetical protein